MEMDEIICLVSPREDSALGYYSLNTFGRFGFSPAVLVPTLHWPLFRQWFLMDSGFRFAMRDSVLDSFIISKLNST